MSQSPPALSWDLALLGRAAAARASTTTPAAPPPMDAHLAQAPGWRRPPPPRRRRATRQSPCPRRCPWPWLRSRRPASAAPSIRQWRREGRAPSEMKMVSEPLATNSTFSQRPLALVGKRQPAAGVLAPVRRPSFWARRFCVQTKPIPPLQLIAQSCRTGALESETSTPTPRLCRIRQRSKCGLEWVRHAQGRALVAGEFAVGEATFRRLEIRGVVGAVAEETALELGLGLLADMDARLGVGEEISHCSKVPAPAPLRCGCPRPGRRGSGSGPAAGRRGLFTTTLGPSLEKISQSKSSAAAFFLDLHPVAGGSRKCGSC